VSTDLKELVGKMIRVRNIKQPVKCCGYEPGIFRPDVASGVPKGIPFVYYIKPGTHTWCIAKAEDIIGVVEDD